MKLKKNILIVEPRDEMGTAIRETISNRLKDTGYEAAIIHAKDGAAAAIKSENQKFDIVIIDTEVPRLMDGGFVYGIASYKNTQDAEVIILSTREKEDLPSTLQSARYLKKPAHPEVLIEAMIDAINEQHLGKKSPIPLRSSKKSPKPRLIVDVRVINAVIKSTNFVMKQFGCPQAIMEPARVKPPHEALPGEIVSVVTIESESFNGYLCVSFDKNSYLEVTSAMFMEEQNELNDENVDAVGEINNIIFGNAKSEISNLGIKLTVPTVHRGPGYVVESPEGSAGMLIPFKTVKGMFYITVLATPPL